ncbi:MAG: TonB-dependent receptor, partial [Acidobacteriia bacterium]|nr:TonB-dependent receptor [Terriglobia bacterium]
MELKVESRKLKVKGPTFVVSSKRRTSGPQRTYLVAFLLGFVILFASAGPAARAATLDGTVFDPSGRAVRGARVSLLTPLVPLEECQTDARGRFEFSGLRGGTYRLVATVPGFAVTPVQVKLGEREMQTVDLRLALSAVQEHVVVSATLGGALSPQVGSSIDVLTRRDLDEQGAQAVFEILREVPGVAVNQTGRRGGVTGLFIRGGNSNYNLVMLDGMQVNQFGGDFDFASLPVDGVERVEITRGPQSALYGSNAVTGVINIV